MFIADAVSKMHDQGAANAKSRRTTRLSGQSRSSQCRYAAEDIGAETESSDDQPGADMTTDKVHADNALRDATCQANCEMHCDLFKHYSLMLFRARTLIVSVILLIFAFLLGLKKIETAATKGLFNLEPAAVIAYVSAIIIALLYSMETAYIRRLAEVAASARHGNKSDLTFDFFDRYRPLWHWPLLALYFCAVLFLVSISWSHASVGASDAWKMIALVVAALPLCLLAFTTKSHKVELERID